MGLRENTLLTIVFIFNILWCFCHYCHIVIFISLCLILVIIIINFTLLLSSFLSLLFIIVIYQFGQFAIDTFILCWSLFHHNYYLYYCCCYHFQLYYYYYYYQTPGLGQKGPIKQGPSFRPSVHSSVHPSFCLSVSFLRIGPLVFSETQHSVRSPYLVMCDRAIFFWENPHRAKMTKNGQKMAQKYGFGTFQENHVFSFVWNLCKMKFLIVHQHSAKTTCL